MMTKKEQAAFEALREELARAKAFRFTEPVVRDLPPPKDFNSLSKGWDFFANGDYFRVEKACSSSVYHHFGDWVKTTTQNPRTLFSTRLLALRACRNSLEEQFSKVLARIDRQIAVEQEGVSE